MVNLKNRIERLEKSISPINQETEKLYKYTWDDWTWLELANALFTPTRELEQKAQLTDWPNRCVGISDDEKARLLKDAEELINDITRPGVTYEVTTVIPERYDMAAAWLISYMAGDGAYSMKWGFEDD